MLGQSAGGSQSGPARSPGPRGPGSTTVVSQIATPPPSGVGRAWAFRPPGRSTRPARGAMPGPGRKGRQPRAKATTARTAPAARIVTTRACLAALRVVSSSARIAWPAVAAETLWAAASVRHLTSTVPSFSPRSPITTRSGMPIRSASLNLTPGRWSRSSIRHVEAGRLQAARRAPGRRHHRLGLTWSGTSRA